MVENEFQSAIKARTSERYFAIGRDSCVDRILSPFLVWRKAAADWFAAWTTSTEHGVFGMILIEDFGPAGVRYDSLAGIWQHG